MFERIDHIGVLIDSLERGADIFADMGLRISREVRIPGRLRANFYSCGNAEIELIDISEPTERARRLGQAAACIEHIAVEVADIRDALAALARIGVQSMTPEPVRLESGYSAMTRAETSAGIVFQIMQKIQAT